MLMPGSDAEHARDEVSAVRTRGTTALMLTRGVVPGVRAGCQAFAAGRGQISAAQTCPQGAWRQALTPHAARHTNPVCLRNTPSSTWTDSGSTGQTRLARPCTPLGTLQLAAGCWRGTAAPEPRHWPPHLSRTCTGGSSACGGRGRAARGWRGPAASSGAARTSNPPSPAW